MSRVGQAPVPIPSGVEIKIEGRQVLKINYYKENDLDLDVTRDEEVS